MRISDIFIDPFTKDVVKKAEDDARARLAGLTNQQQQVLTFLANGASNKHIANELSISERTVEAHRAAIMSRTGYKHVSELIKFVILSQ